jgi:hypothetical protein
LISISWVGVARRIRRLRAVDGTSAQSPSIGRASTAAGGVDLDQPAVPATNNNRPAIEECAAVDWIARDVRQRKQSCS